MHVIWVIVGICFLLLDLKFRRTYLVSMGAAVLFYGILDYKYFTSVRYGLIALPILFLVFYFLINSICKKEELEKKSALLLEDIEGKKVTVKKDIGKTLSIDGLGLVEYKGVSFSAKNILDKEIKAGVEVEVVSKENLILNVKTIEKEEYAKH